MCCQSMQTRYNFSPQISNSYFSNPSPFLDCWGFGVDATCTIGWCSVYVSSNRLQPHHIEEHRGASSQLHQRLCDPQVLYLMSSSTGIQTMISMKQELASIWACEPNVKIWLPIYVQCSWPWLQLFIMLSPPDSTIGALCLLHLYDKCQKINFSMQMSM